MSMQKIFPRQVYGELEVIKTLGKSTGSTKYECKCACGNIVPVRGTNLTKGKAKSCGCKSNDYRSKASTTHGLSKTRTYRIWKGMKTRCYNKAHKHFKHYGGKGISVCKQWLSAEGFFDYWGEISEPMTIDRRDNSKNYEPSNCRLRTQKEQANNRSDNVILTHQGKTMTLSEWADYLNISYATLNARNFRGDSISKILQKEIKKNIIVNHKGVDMNLSQLAKEVKIGYTTLMARYKAGKRDAELIGEVV